MPMARTEPRGFSLVEFMLSLTIFAIFAFASLGVQGVLRSTRIQADARGIASQLQLARMRAASDFTKVRIKCNLAANTYQLEVWSKGAGAYQVEGGVTNLSSQVSFSTDSIATAAGAQSA